MKRTSYALALTVSLVLASAGLSQQGQVAFAQNAVTTAVQKLDSDGRRETLLHTINDAVAGGRLSQSDATSFRSELERIRNSEAAARQSGKFGFWQRTRQTLELEVLSQNIEKAMGARQSADLTDLPGRRSELAARIQAAQANSTISQLDGNDLKVKLDQIARDEATMRAGGTLSNEQTLQLAIQIDKVASRLDSLLSGSAGNFKFADKRTELTARINSLKASGKLDSLEADALTQEVGRLESREKAMLLGGRVLTNEEKLQLALDFEKVNSRLERYDLGGGTAGSGNYTGKIATVMRRLDAARVSGKVSDLQYADLRQRLDQVVSRERRFSMDGTLTPMESNRLNDDIEAVSEALRIQMNPIDTGDKTRLSIERRMNEGLGTGRLSTSDEGELRADLNRIVQLEQAFRSGGRTLTADQNAAIEREYSTLSAKLDRALTPVQDLKEKYVGIDRRLKEGEASGVLSASQVTDLRKEMHRIATVETNFRNSDNNFSEFESTAVIRDLDKLDSDVTRLMAATNIPAATTGSGPSDTRGHWAESYVGQLTQRNIIGGFPDGSFKPDDGITRAQFAAIAMKALSVKPAAGPAQFVDVPGSYWANKAIAAVSAAGLVTGFPDGTFKPEDKITRAQALVILAKALPASSGDASILNSYQDGSSVPGWAAPSVAKAARARILVSYPDPSAIRPNVNATRADVAALTYQTLLNLGQKLPQIRVGLE